MISWKWTRVSIYGNRVNLGVNMLWLPFLIPLNNGYHSVIDKGGVAW